MPKPTPLYNHNSRTATACQLNISSVSGQSSYLYTSSQVPVAPPVAQDSNRQHEYPMPDFNMDIDETEDCAPINLNAIDKDTPDGRPPIEVIPSVHVHVVPAKRYANSVGVLWISTCAITHITLSKTSPFKLGQTVKMIIWMNVWRWKGVVHSIQLVLVVEHQCHNIGAKTAWWDHYGAKVV
jgi:hypothetical protein